MLKLTRLWKKKISTQTHNQNSRKKCCNELKLHSEKNGVIISKLQLQHFMQNSILEQAKVAELYGAGCPALKNDEFY